jgi:hypothetical protein
MAILDQSPNPADISVCISVIHPFFYQPPSICIPIITIHYSNLSAEDITAATTAMEAARIAWTKLGLSTQSKGKRKVTEEEPSSSQYVS